MATLVFLKEKGLPTADIFRGTFNGPDDNPSEWDYITRDSRFQSKLQFLILDFANPTELPAVYRSKLRRSPQLFFSVAGSQPLEYRDKLGYPSLQNWLFQQLATVDLSPLPSSPQVTRDDDLPPPMISGNPSTSTAPPPTNNAGVPPTPSLTPSNSNGSSASKVEAPASALPSEGMNMSGAVVGGGLILFGFAVMGAIIGGVLAPDEEAPRSAILTYDDGTPVDFSTIVWEEEKKPTWGWPSWLSRKKANSDESNFSDREVPSLLIPPTDVSTNTTPVEKKSGSQSPGLLNGDDEVEL